MKFYCISDSPQLPSTTLLQTSAAHLNLNFQLIDPTKTDLSQLPVLGKDLLYRVATTQLSHQIETSIYNHQVATFYRFTQDNFILKHFSERSLVLEKAHLPVPRTIHHLTTNRTLLRHYVDQLGGLPIILKTKSSHGTGVIKVDSYSSLFSLVDFLSGQHHSFKLRQFITCQSSARLIVLGDQVVDSVEYLVQGDDFRSNVGNDLQVVPKTFSPHYQQIAIQAVNCLGNEFGGVDIITDPNGQPFITEVNFPCNFARCQLLTHTLISNQMLKFLINKSHHINP